MIQTQKEMVEEMYKIEPDPMEAFSLAVDCAMLSKPSLSDTLNAREETHGKFATQALISQSMKKWVRNGKNWSNMDADMRESIDMILHKVARIVNGDQYHLDSWHDISGYATLVENRLSI